MFGDYWLSATINPDAECSVINFTVIGIVPIVINSIAAGTMDEEALDEQFQKLYDEEQSLNERLEQIKAENSIDPDDSDRIDRTLKEIDKNSCELLEYNDILTRKLIECVRVVSKTEIQIIFKGGYEVTAEVEK